MTNRWLFLSIILLGMSGTLAGQDPPEQPEVTISHTSRGIVLAQMTDFLTPQKFHLVNSTESVATYEKEGGFLEMLLVGSKYDSRVVYRITFNLISLDATSIRLLANGVIVGNPNSAFERQTPLNTKRHRRDLQSLLESIRAFSADKVATPPAAVAQPTTSPKPQTPTLPTEAETLQRDLADVRRLKRLAAPGSKDLDYYTQLEAETESRIAALDLLAAAPVQVIADSSAAPSPTPPQESVEATRTVEVGGLPVGTRWIASVSQKMYYPVGCAALSAIPDPDRLYYTTEDGLKLGGFKRSIVCP